MEKEAWPLSVKMVGMRLLKTTNQIETIIPRVLVYYSVRKLSLLVIYAPGNSDFRKNKDHDVVFFR